MESIQPLRPTVGDYDNRNGLYRYTRPSKQPHSTKTVHWYSYPATTERQYRESTEVSEVDRMYASHRPERRSHTKMDERDDEIMNRSADRGRPDWNKHLADHPPRAVAGGLPDPPRPSIASLPGPTSGHGNREHHVIIARPPERFTTSWRSGSDWYAGTRWQQATSAHHRHHHTHASSALPPHPRPRTSGMDDPQMILVTEERVDPAPSTRISSNSSANYSYRTAPSPVMWRPSFQRGFSTGAAGATSASAQPSSIMSEGRVYVSRHHEAPVPSVHLPSRSSRPGYQTAVTSQLSDLDSSSTVGGSSTATAATDRQAGGKRSFENSFKSSSSLSNASESKKGKIQADLPTASRAAARGFDMLDLLCSATLEMGPLHDNPSGCSCPKSKCIALYCDCFKAGRRCTVGMCSCLNCMNTLGESGINGARTKAIRSILARNPRAFSGTGNSSANKPPPGELACNCIRSRCLKLYCTCFQSGKVCNDKVCTCVGCLNTEDDVGGKRLQAMQQCLEKRPDAFDPKKKAKELGSGCACKNNRCIRKYCECFRTNLKCTEKCSCRDCENPEDHE